MRLNALERGIPAHGGYPGEVVARRPHELADCERELRARPDHSPGFGTPEVFECSCGNVFDFRDDEATGAWWQLRPRADFIDVTLTRRPL